MRNGTAAVINVLIVLLTCVSAGNADEGMWLLNELDKLPWDSLKAQGMQLAPEEIYSTGGKGLIGAIAGVTGASGSFVSSDGLIVTNHHVAYNAIQKQSTPEHNYIDSGFYAATRDRELPAIGYDIYVLENIEDVTSTVKAAVADTMTGRERYDAIDAATKKIIEKAESGRDVRCRVGTMYDGMQYLLFTFFRITDVRLVFAPPNAIGEFGGEIDNWMWPRHAGDFAFMRAYVAPDGSSAPYAPENVPYRPKTFLTLSQNGINEKDLVFIIGYPGKTSRHNSSFVVDRVINEELPRDIATMYDVLDILEQSGAADSSVAVRVSSRMEGLSNYLKKDMGVLDGFDRAGLLDLKIAKEEALLNYLGKNPAQEQKYGWILPALDSLEQVRAGMLEKQDLLGWLGYLSDYVSCATTIYRWAMEKEKSDIDREPGYQNRDTTDIKRRLRERQVNMVPDVEKRVIGYFLSAALRLPQEQNLRVLDVWLASHSDEDPVTAVLALSDSLVQYTAVADVDERIKMFSMTCKQLDALDDPLINFARAIEKERDELKKLDHEYEGAISRAMPQLMEAYSIMSPGSLYPDANGTPRLTYGSVQGYWPRDAVYYHWITSFSGLMAKDEGEEPFDVTDAVRSVYETSDYGAYYNVELGDVPVDFLSTCDITGGNSGSAVLNGRGELVGLAFDGNLEAVASDFVFQPEITRTISVDIRYVLFLLDRVYKAEALLRELTVK